MDKRNSISEKEALQLFSDTSSLIGNRNAGYLALSLTAAQNSNALSNNVEYWRWMQRNYRTSGIFDSNISMQQYISQSSGKEGWMYKQLQGKGYEWDWMVKQRNNPQNLLNIFDAGDVANRAASDVTKRNIITGKSKEYQMKAYLSKSNPDLHNTPKDMTVVTNAEKVSVVQENGYASVEEFKDACDIRKTTDKRMQQIKKGSASPTYNIKNVAGTMAKSGIIGCMIGMGTESISLYKCWKSNKISDDEYVLEILKAGGEAGITSGATAGIMIPVSAAVTVAGMSSLITIPIAFVIGGALDKVIAPCFGRGDYRKYLSQAKYYQNIELCYSDFISSVETSANSFSEYIDGIVVQNQQYSALKQIDKSIDKELKDLYDEI